MAALGVSAPVVWRRLGFALSVLGPGLVVMAGDNDAGGLLSYVTTGVHFGAGVFVPLLVPLGLAAWVAQDMALRLGLGTGRGLATLIRERFSASWARLAALDLAAQNWLTLLTEFAGMRVGLARLGVPALWALPAACALVLWLALAFPYRVAERLAVGLGLSSLVLLPLALTGWAHKGAAVWTLHHDGDLHLFVLAAVGNALAPWMTFFQTDASAQHQGSLGAARLDLTLGAAVQVVVAASVLLLGAAGGGPQAPGLGGVIFAFALFEAGLMAALTVSLSTAWAVGEVLAPAPLAHGAWSGRVQALWAAGVVAAAAALLLPGVDPTALSVWVQAASAVLMPPVLAMLLVMTNQDWLPSRLRNSPAANAAGLAVLAMFGGASLWMLVRG